MTNDEILQHLIEVKNYVTGTHGEDVLDSIMDALKSRTKRLSVIDIINEHTSRYNNTSYANKIIRVALKALKDDIEDRLQSEQSQVQESASNTSETEHYRGIVEKALDRAVEARRLHSEFLTIMHAVEKLDEERSELDHEIRRETDNFDRIIEEATDEMTVLIRLIHRVQEDMK